MGQSCFKFYELEEWGSGFQKSQTYKFNINL